MTTTKAPGSFGIFRREFIALLIERFSSNFGQIDAPILLYLGTRRSSRVSPEQFRFDVLPSINPHQCDCAKRLGGGGGGPPPPPPPQPGTNNKQKKKNKTPI